MVIINNKNSINYKDTGFLKYRATSSEELIVYETTDLFSKPSVNVSGLSAARPSASRWDYSRQKKVRRLSWDRVYPRCI